VYPGKKRWTVFVGRGEFDHFFSNPCRGRVSEGKGGGWGDQGGSVILSGGG